MEHEVSLVPVSWSPDPPALRSNGAEVSFRMGWLQGTKAGPSPHPTLGRGGVRLG